MKKQPALSAAHCQVLQQPFYQFAQMKQFAPDSIEGVKAQYRAAWTDWRDFVLAVQAALAAQGIVFAAPHIERWCNGWQVRAHFFAFFKYARHENDAAILSVLLNRRRLTVSLDWHCYKADRSTIALPQYNQWLDDLDAGAFGEFDVWHGSEDEYADYAPLNRQPENALTLRDADDFFCIGKHVERDDLDGVDSVAWIVAQVQALLPLYERCFE